MGTLTVKEILKILNALNKTKKIRRRRRKKKLAQGLVNNNIKSVSDHMTGNIITGEHLRSMQNNNELKMKAIQNEIDYNSNNKINDINNTIKDVQIQGLNYLKNYNNRLNKMENTLSNIPNQSLTRENTQNYSNNSNVITSSDPYLSMSTETNLQPDQHTQEEEESRKFSTIEDTIKPSNLTTDTSPIIQEIDDEEKDIEGDNNEETKNDNKEEIVYDDDKGNEIKDDTTEKDNVNNTLLNFLQNNKNMDKKNLSKITKEEKKEIYKVLRYYGESNPSSKKNYTIYKKFKEIASKEKLISESDNEE